ncbi:Lrp/AsnC family transcriptional regulator [Neoaquamicrobium sediminum]|uniref:Lrp/AsnC family transcriptional regulator n=1 Tax=Neoaquamicrobium sediminum TaxID=1849104 RepID=UPI001565AD23|nr:Lrp/AsnC family transcriptional regulator [Mesorhizobium sediminum]NRC52719.1 Lrp/AsnC family transcriptional regulator [Mesorhizobium sediminum]
MNELRDNIDRQLVGLLLADGRASATELARKLGVGRSTVQERIARLERSGLIAGYSAILSHDPFGDAAQALVMVSIVQRRQKDILDRLRALPEVVNCLTIAGDYDLVLTVQTPRVEDIDAVLDEILGFEGIERCKSWIILGRHIQRGAAATGQAAAVTEGPSAGGKSA